MKRSLLILGFVLVAAYVAGQFSSRSVVTEIEIEAPPDAVWAVLSDTGSYPDWNPLILAVDGELAPGNQLSATLKLPDNAPMQFRPTVLELVENQTLRWIGRTGFTGIFDGEHYFILDETDRGTTRFVHGENFSGMIVFPLMALIGADTEAGFNAMNAALKATVETGN